MKKSIFIGLVALFSFGYSSAQCASNIIITAAYSTTLTQSNNWIVTTGTTTISSGANVNLEATNYVQLNPDFKADATAVFLAQIVPCTLGNQQNSLSGFKVYPNPTSGQLNIKTINSINAVTVFDGNGRVLQSNNDIQNNEFTTNLDSFSNGIYFVEIVSDQEISRHKIIKQ